MEVYFKELISGEASLEKLVDDLERVVQGVDDYVRAIGSDLGEAPQNEFGRRLHRLRDGCQRIRLQIVSKARATDKLVRRKPYPFVGAAVLLGMIAGMQLGARK